MTKLKIKRDDGVYIEDSIRGSDSMWRFYMPGVDIFICPDQVFEINKITKSYSSTEGRSILFDNIFALMEDFEKRPEKMYVFGTREFYLFGSENEIEPENIKFNVYEGSRKLLEIATNYPDRDSLFISMTLPKKTFEKLYDITIPKNHSLYLTIEDFISPSNGFLGCMHMPDHFSPYVKFFSNYCVDLFSKKDYTYLDNLKKKKVNDFKFHFAVSENPDLVDAEIADREYEIEKEKKEKDKSLFWIGLIGAAILASLLF